MANVCPRQLEYKMRHGTKGISKRDGMNKITINFSEFMYHMKFATGHLCSAAIILKISLTKFQTDI